MLYITLDCTLQQKKNNHFKHASQQSAFQMRHAIKDDSRKTGRVPSALADRRECSIKASAAAATTTTATTVTTVPVAVDSVVSRCSLHVTNQPPVFCDPRNNGRSIRQRAFNDSLVNAARGQPAHREALLKVSSDKLRELGVAARLI